MRGKVFLGWDSALCHATGRNHVAKMRLELSKCHHKLVRSSTGIHLRIKMYISTPKITEYHSCSRNAEYRPPQQMLQARARVSVPSTGKGKASMMMKVLSGVTWRTRRLEAFTLTVTAIEAVAVEPKSFCRRETTQRRVQRFRRLTVKPTRNETGSKHFDIKRRP